MAVKNQSKQVDDKKTWNALNFNKNSLIVLLGYFVILTILQQGFIYGVQHILNIVALVFVIKETEILFYSHSQNLDRAQAKALAKNNHYLITALTIGVFVPYFTPVIITIMVGIVAVLITKLVFGGFEHRFVSPALVAIIILSVGFRISLSSVVIPNTFDTQIFNALASTRLFSNWINFSISIDSTATVWRLVVAGLPIFLILVFVRLLKDRSSLLLPMVLLFLMLLANYTLNFDVLEFVFQFEALFILLFVLTDRILLPKNDTSKIILAFIITIVAAFMFSNSVSHAVVYATLFALIMVPMMNQHPLFNSSNKTTKYVVNIGLSVVGIFAFIQAGWLYFGPQIGRPKVDVLQYFEEYDPSVFVQNLESSRLYNEDAYGTIQGVYEIFNTETSTIEVLMYNMVSDGFWGPINVIVVVNPYTDTIVNYYVVRHEEVQGAAYFDAQSVEDIIGLSIEAFNIPEDLNAGATGTWNALQLIVDDVINQYQNEEVSLNEDNN